MQRPDFRPPDRSHLPVGFRQFQLEQDRQQFRIGRHARGDTHHEVIFQRPGIHPGLPVHSDAAHDTDVEAFEFGNRLGALHHLQIVRDLLNRVVEHHRRPGPGVVALDLEVIQRARVAGRHLGPGLADAIERAGIIRARSARGVIDDDARASLADRLLDLAGHADLPRRQVSLVRRLLAQVDVHHAGAGIEGCPGLARHFLRRDRHMVLFRIGQHAVQRAGDDGLVAHGAAFNSLVLREIPGGSCVPPVPASCVHALSAVTGPSITAAPDGTRHCRARPDRCGKSPDPASPRKSRAAAVRRSGGSNG